MDDRLLATVRRTYQLPGKRLLLLEDTYSGGVESGERVEIELPEERRVQVLVDSVAWGSAYRAENPPLTLIVLWGDEPDPPPGSKVRGVV